MRTMTRRKVLLGMGSLMAAAGCGSDPEAAQPTVDAGVVPPPAPTKDASPPPPPPAPPRSAKELLAGIDTVVVLMMENRSFDHYLGQLKQDAKYPSRADVDGLVGGESNLTKSGAKVVSYKLTNFTVDDPPHEWDACHTQFNGGKNDGFCISHEGAFEREVMGWHDRSQIPFMYWLADNYTVCDRWFASVMGPTWPNRFYLHAATSKGKKGNTPFLVGAPPSIWEQLKAEGKTYVNYYAGRVSWYTGGFVGKVPTMHPVKKIDELFADAKAGSLPNFVLIDPDFEANDDHPAHDIQRGQAFIAAIYKALSESPQWSKMLFVITYDEHGGFYDHVVPPKTVDPDPEFAQLGFRVPSIVIGPTVRRGYVDHTQLEHVSVAATLETCFGIASLGKRMDEAADLSSCIDPERFQSPSPPAPDPPTVVMLQSSALYERIGGSSQQELERMIARGEIAPEHVDTRNVQERTRAWLRHAEASGAVKIVR